MKNERNKIWICEEWFPARWIPIYGSSFFENRYDAMRAVRVISRAHPDKQFRVRAYVPDVESGEHR